MAVETESESWYNYLCSGEYWYSFTPEHSSLMDVRRTLNWHAIISHSMHYSSLLEMLLLIVS